MFEPEPGVCFVPLRCHISSRHCQYRTTFISKAYIVKNWSDYFEIVNIVRGAIHGFKGLVALRRRDDGPAAEPQCLPPQSASPR
ncbi:MAG: hypothetical protein L0Y60_11410 [Beijerinckiaceae bacterium]|nr:hypothetical protein [Beijerinckiaceae bacterium]